MKRSFVLKVVVAVFVVLAIAVGALPMFTPAEAGPCRCPLVYAPVQCDHDRVYPNPCVAECHHARNCVPLPLE